MAKGMARYPPERSAGNLFLQVFDIEPDFLEAYGAFDMSSSTIGADIINH
jgi:hypothetical protein